MAEVKWIKITTDIFSDEKVMLIEQMPEADTMLVIWFKLLCMAGKENNYGVFLMRNRMPYTEEMLATIFRRPLNTVRLALSTFEAFGMIEIEDDIISIPNWEKHQNIDGMERIREQTRKRVADYRQRQKQLAMENDVTKNVTLRNATEEDKNRKEEDKKEKKNNTPTVYYPSDDALNQAFADYVDMRKKIKKPLTDRAIVLSKNKLHELSGGNNSLAIQIIEQSILNSWQSLYPLKGDDNAKNVKGGKASAGVRNDAKGYDASEYYGDKQSEFTGF